MKIPAARITRIIAGAAAFVLFCGSVGDTFAQSATFEVKDEGGKKRKNITVVKDGEVLYSGPVGKRAAWLSGDKSDSVRGKIRSALRGGDKNIRINATGNTVTIVIDDNDDGDSTRRFEMNITGNEFGGLGRNIMRVFGNVFGSAFGEGGASFHFNTRSFRDMARQVERSFHFSMPPRAPGFFWYNDSDEFESDKATQMAEEAKRLEREAAAMRKEAEAMRLESEAMRKRSEALRLEAEAQKKSKTDGVSQATKPADKKK
jgi:hypothetical protein